MPTCLCNQCEACERRRKGGQTSLLGFACGPRSTSRSAEFGPLPRPLADRTDPSPFANVRFVAYALDYLRAVVDEGKRGALVHPLLQPPSAVPGEVVTGLFTEDLRALEGMRAHYNARLSADTWRRGMRPLSHVETTLSVDRALCAAYLGLLKKYTARCAMESVASADATAKSEETIDESAARMARCAVGSVVKAIFKPYRDWSQNMTETAMVIVTQASVRAWPG
jgi:hypothetical protein